MSQRDVKASLCLAGNYVLAALNILESKEQWK